MHGQPGQDVGAKTLEAERKDFNQEGQQVDGFASSVVPTLEEKTVEQQRPPKERADEDGDTHNDHESPRVKSDSGEHISNSGSYGPRSGDGVLFGAPANAPSPSVDNKPPVRSRKDDADEEQQAAPTARASIRENLVNRSGKKHPWTVPTAKPRVEPEDFEDPLSESFWKDIWLASAVHNVSAR